MALMTYEKLYTKEGEHFLLQSKMSDYYDIRKLCLLSRLEIDDAEVQQTGDKIKETISFFNKLDEFEMNEPSSDNPDIIIASEQGTYLKFEKKINDLRDDTPHKKIDSSCDLKENTLFDFKFHPKKNGYVIGPKI
jgi:Asp-tRNA(Asn)/Glu-tRNA(Gln) amidotransferase C subunit